MTTILTSSRLSRLAAYPHLSSSWHYLSAAILSVCNHPQEIPALYKYAMEVTPKEDHARVTSEMRESLLKAAALIGLPRTINSLTELKNVTPEELRLDEPLRSDDTDFEKVGESFFAKVYGKITKRIHYQLHTAYPDLNWFIIKHEYGPLLSFTKILGAKETSLVVVASLVPQDVNPQLKGHLKGAVNNGSSVEEVNSVRDMAIELSQWCGVQPWRSEVAKL
ncbi:hypothetical protein B9G98_00358 [Wickerhamiella sorbophila]|uniref:Carboxymuconolactone decarboxylase-like domain-containing protein n=1 Tax=Wickerhamiella sorbophila TaxID=45607 RepID=A0A2T0FCK8_9ASCO|nr:hypothetical protein B9G98_00358 [Wickerhamiella sorbophila]PRT52738.1 hypothetical protein B9G98_00358 [Wickerhamiella sorbophila]